MNIRSRPVCTIALAILCLSFSTSRLFAYEIKVHIKYSSDKPDAKISIKWGYPYKEDHSQTIIAGPGEKGEKDFTIDVKEMSEFEIKTVGGPGTGYELRADVTGKGTLLLTHEPNQKQTKVKLDVKKRIRCKFSNQPNDAGDCSMRILILER